MVYDFFMLSLEKVEEAKLAASKVMRWSTVFLGGGFDGLEGKTTFSLHINFD